VVVTLKAAAVEPSLMLDVAVMIEGQAGLNWERWRELGPLVEDLGFQGLFRSDHFTGAEGPYEDSLGLWPSLTWLAAETDRIDFGPLVTPTSFRHPVHTARMGRDVDDLSGGRLTLGVGAGWQEREHETFGFDLLPLGPRFDRFEEGVEVVHRLLGSEAPVSFDGEHYELDGARLVPPPDRQGGPDLLVGGNGRQRTLPLAARFADEWNGVLLPVEAYADRNDHLDDLLAEAGRASGDVTRSMMTRVLFGRDDEEVDELLDGRDADELREQGAVVGTAAEVAEHLDRLAAAGADRVMLQWLALEDHDRLAALADEVA
jgi:F420-dependent oxidoreductase-like protein